MGPQRRPQRPNIDWPSVFHVKCLRFIETMRNAKSNEKRVFHKFASLSVFRFFEVSKNNNFLLPATKIYWMIERERGV